MIFTISCNRSHDFKMDLYKDIYHKSAIEILNNTEEEYKFFNLSRRAIVLDTTIFNYTLKVFNDLGINSIYKCKQSVIFYYDRDTFFNRRADILIYQLDSTAGCLDEYIIDKEYGDNWSEGRIASFLY